MPHEQLKYNADAGSTAADKTPSSTTTLSQHKEQHMRRQTQTKRQRPSALDLNMLKPS
jgi:hypothetical protein